jgi:hypothetical protein
LDGGAADDEKIRMTEAAMENERVRATRRTAVTGGVAATTTEAAVEVTAVVSRW